MVHQKLESWMCAFLAILCTALLCEAKYSSVDCFGIPFDEKLVKLMNYRNGVFIEVGANDGMNQSNTKLTHNDYLFTKKKISK